MRREPEHKLWGIVLAAGEGTRVRPFLQRLCGGRGIKQFCAVIGRRSMLEHTLARVERLIPRERIVVVVSQHHRDEAARQLAHWPAENVVYQPANRDTLPGILLPLAHITYRSPLATVAVFPSDHFILDEETFMAMVGRAAAEVHRFPQELILLGVTPDRAEDGYGWIEPAQAEAGRDSRAVRRFWEKPSHVQIRALLARGALWNTLVFVVHATTLWEMSRQVAPDLCQTFHSIRLMLHSAHADLFTAHAYETMRAVNFSHGVCERLGSSLRVLPVPDVGWSDWGRAERILASLQRLGKLNDCLGRLRHQGGAAPFPERSRRRPTPHLQ
ncbi:MAG: sugar phosphate nucleotidyltransferase [Thermodesulfobacteriota bacterium]|jgi:mannose-1-phosphate guanylyltransferase